MTTTCAKFGTCRLPLGHAGLCVFAPRTVPVVASGLPLLLGVGVAGDQVIIEAGRGWIALAPAEALTVAEVLVHAAACARAEPPDKSRAEVH
jgi:hypothetical protein